jgi:hypothetical protein
MTPPATAAATRPRRSTSNARPLTVAPRPRRVSGPARPRPSARPAPRAGSRHARTPGLVAALLRLLDLRTVDRLVRGRFAIGLVAFALIGIVTLQLGLLKLNAGIGRTLDREAVLQRENSVLGIENSELAAGGRIQSRAAELGMAAVPTGDLRFLHAQRGDAGRAVAALGSSARALAARARETEIAIANADTQAASAESGTASAGAGATTSTAGTGAATSTSGGGAGQGEGSVATSASGGSTAAAASEAPAGAAATGARATGASTTGGPAGEGAAGGPGGGTQASPAG